MFPVVKNLVSGPSRQHGSRIDALKIADPRPCRRFGRTLTPTGVAFLLLVSGCGGGGGGGDSRPPTPPPDTQPPVLSGVQNTTIDRGEAFDPLDGVTARDNVDGDLTASITSMGTVDVDLPGAYTVTYSVTDAARNTATATRVVTVVVPSGLPNVDTEAVFSGFYDIATGRPAGSQVIGRINLKRNRNVATSPVPGDYSFDIIEDDSGGMFDIREERDGDGRLFGVFAVAEGQTARAGSYALRVELRQGADVLARFSAPVTVAERTQWEIYYERAVDFVSRTSRLTGGRNYSDSEVAAWITELEAGDGGFKGLGFYSATTAAQWLDIGTATLTDELEEAANRIGGLGKAYLRSPTYGPSGQDADRDRLRNAIYLALIAYVDHFPLNDFANFEGIGFGHRSHQWLFSDPIGGAAVLIYEDLVGDMTDGVEQADEVKERLFRFLQRVNFDLTEGARAPENTRYYLEDRLAESSGAWADANRHHRMRSWATMPVIWRDYNRPLTELPWWYDDYEPFAAELTGIVPEWRPSGSFADLKVWLETNARLAKQYGQSGLVPDGTISHHVGRRQDVAFWAYGFPWMTGTPFGAVALLADTRWKVSNAPYDRTAEFLLFAYPRLIYRDGIDFQVVGRSHYVADAGIFGSDVLAGGIDNVLEARSVDTVITRVIELTDLQARMRDGTHEVSGNTGFWANDYMIHRSGGEVGEQPYFMSVKMQSARTRGAESISQSNGFHNGSGVLLVKVDGNEYNDSRFRWDWHALPGVTEELRTDQTPRQSDSNLFNPNHFAGTASNGRYGLAAFRYASDDPYASAAANKGYFFVKDYALALGNDVRRVRNTDGSDSEPIVTTLDQAAWDTILTYRLHGAPANAVVLNGATVDRSLEVTGPSWFHQDRVGYVILPAGDTRVTLRGGGAVIDSDPSDTDSGDVFHLAIDHGSDPDGSGANGQYAYLLVPNVSAAEMPGVVNDIQSNLEMLNTPHAQGHRYADEAMELVQLAFYSAGTASFANGLEVAVDKPALVQLLRSGSGWNIAVQNPTHHADEDAIASSDEFEHILLPDANRITVDVSLRLTPGVYTYDTQGPLSRFIAGQTVDVTVNGDGTSRLTVNLADRMNAFDYEYREEFYAGMPAVVDVP